MINDKISVTGSLHIVLRDKDGNIKTDVTVPNLVVTSGKNLIASRLVGTTPAVMSHMAVGTNSAAPAASQTALLTEIGRAALTSSIVLNNVVTYTAVFGPGVGTGAITETGLLNAGTAGSMLARTAFLPVNKDTLDSLTINWAITVA